MDCVNHPGVSATAFCQNCGKALCASCVRTAPGGQVLCEPCFTTWQTFQQPFVPVSTGMPNPAAAAVLGLIPGVGAMYNGQFFKGLIHVVIFAVLVSMAHISGIFGIFIPAWILYQAFEAFHTARAIRDGQPVPDPLGLNEVGHWFNLGRHPQYPPQPPAGQPPVNPGPYAGTPGAGPIPPPPPPGTWQTPYSGGAYQNPYQTPYAPPAAGPGVAGPGFAGPGAAGPGAAGPGSMGGTMGTDPAAYSAAGYTPVDPNAPPIPPGPPIGQRQFWQRKEPIGAIVLIALGVLFLLGQLDIFNGRLIEFSWPVFLIGVGIWLVVRRLGESQGGPK